MRALLVSVVAGCLLLFIGASVQGSYTYTPLDVPGASDTYAFGIDGDHIVGQYYSGGNVHGFLHDEFDRHLHCP